MLILCHKSCVLLNKVVYETNYLDLLFWALLALGAIILYCLFYFKWVLSNILYCLSSSEFQAPTRINRSRDSYSYIRNSICTRENKPLQASWRWEVDWLWLSKQLSFVSSTGMGKQGGGLGFVFMRNGKWENPGGRALFVPIWCRKWLWQVSLPDRLYPLFWNAWA